MRRRPQQPNPYDTLGVDPKASADEIKQEYRKQAMEHHPDKGGDPEQFSAIAIAYDILGDPDKRARFDAEGEYREQKSADNAACDMIVKMMGETMDGQGKFMFRDFISEMRERMQQTIFNAERKFKSEQERSKHTLKHLQETRKRLHLKPGGLPIMTGFLDQAIETEERAVTLARLEYEDCQRDCNRAIEILDDYSFDMKKEDHQKKPSFWMDEALDWKVTPNRSGQHTATSAMREMYEEMIKKGPLYGHYTPSG